MRDYTELEGLVDYIIVTWPEVQDIMEEDWFRGECFLANPTNPEQDWVGDSAYFVPKRKYYLFLKVQSLMNEGWEEIDE